MPQTLDRIPSENLVELVVRSVYEGDSNRPGGTKVQGISNLQIGTPPGGWSCNAVIDGADGQQILNVVYDGQQYSDTVQGAGADEVRDDADTVHDLVRLAVKVLYEQSNWTVLGISNLSVNGDILTVDAAMENADTGDRVVVHGTYDNSTNTWTDRLIQDIKGDGLRLDAPKKGGRGGSGQPRKCNTGRPCGKSCIAKTKNCRQNPTGVVQQALSQAVTAGGGGIPSLDQAKQTLAKIGEGAEGIVFLSADGKSVYKYATDGRDLNVSEIKAMTQAGSIGASPRVLASTSSAVQMEFLSDYSVFKSLSSGNTTKDQERQLVGGMVKALEKLHDAGLAHGDFHDRNVLVNKGTGDVKVIDFGKATQATVETKWKDVAFMASWYQQSYLFSLPIMRDPVVRAEMDALKLEWDESGTPKIPSQGPSLKKLIEAIEKY